MNQIGRSRNARLNQEHKFTMNLQKAIANLRGASANDHVDQKDDWQDGRNALEQLIQCFHEANAYNNAMEPAKKEILINGCMTYGEALQRAKTGVPVYQRGWVHTKLCYNSKIDKFYLDAPLRAGSLLFVFGSAGTGETKTWRPSQSDRKATDWFAASPAKVEK